MSRCARSPPSPLTAAAPPVCRQVNTLNEQEWEKLTQEHVLATVRSAFDANDGAMAAGTTDDGAGATDDDDEDEDEDEEADSVYDAVDLLSPAGHTDAQTLALMLQEQLDAINNEIRWVGGWVGAGGGWSGVNLAGARNCVFAIGAESKDFENIPRPVSRVRKFHPSSRPPLIFPPSPHLPALPSSSRPPLIFLPSSSSRPPLIFPPSLHLPALPSSSCPPLIFPPSPHVSSVSFIFYVLFISRNCFCRLIFSSTFIITAFNVLFTLNICTPLYIIFIYLFIYFIVIFCSIFNTYYNFR